MDLPPSVQGQPEPVLRVLVDLLKRVSEAPTLADVNIAAGIALEALMRLN